MTETIARSKRCSRDSEFRTRLPAKSRKWFTMQIWLTTNFNGQNASGSIAFSRAGRKKICLIGRFCVAVSNALRPCTRFCVRNERRPRNRAWPGSRNALVAGSVPVFSFSWFRERWRAGGADHNDVQSHGGKAQMALQRSIYQDHGFLPHASGPGGAATRDLHRLPETQNLGRRTGWYHLHFARRNRDDSSELALCSLWEASTGNRRFVCT